ncbi:SdrD B-like domain-containing protein [Aquisphaera giovannonii]|nr:SdrD B-like domain-containing protein [Aquisphaera giovannonii]
MSRQPRSTRRPRKPARRAIPNAAEARLEPRMMPAVITPFAVRYSSNANGDIVFAANTLMTSPGNTSAAVNARNGTGSQVNNNDFSQVYVDADSDPSTFDSSAANLSLPAGGSVLFAGLYWGADSSSSSRNKVSFKAPGASSYSTVTGTIIGSTSDNNYQGFSDVTSTVRAAGAGTYAVGNVQATTGTDEEAGWSLVVVYGDPSAPPRNLTVFDGFAVVDSKTPNVTIPISGFKAPLTGTVNASLGFVSYEGDLGFTGDAVKFNGTTLSDAQNPADNFFNSTISNRGSLVTTKSPNYVNQMGLDADIISKSGLIANGATSASIALTTGGETYYPGVVTTAIDLYAPIVSVSKSVVDLNGGGVEPGDVLEYTDTISVTAGEAATQFVYAEPIPTNATFQAGSLTINGSSQTDASGDDQADYQAALGKITYRLGTGASSSAGGTLAVGQSATVKFRVVVNGTALNGDVVDSQGSAAFVGQSTGASLTATSNDVRKVVAREEDLALTQTVDNPTPQVGQTIKIDLSVVNSEDVVVSGVAVKDLLPAGLTYVSSTPAAGTTYDPTTGTWSVGTVDGLSPLTLTIYAKVVGTVAVTNTATITASGSPDSDTANNVASVTITPQVADLSLTKAVDVARPNVGDTVTFTTTVNNLGPAAASGVSIQDGLPAGFSFVSASGGSYSNGTWTLSSVPVGTTTLTIKAVVSSPSAATMTATILGSSTYDPASSNNSASVSVTPRQVDVAITKSVDVAQPNVGGAVVLTTRVRNLGPDAATGIVVLSPVGAGLTIVSVSAPAGTTYNQATGVWTVGSLAPSGQLTLAVTATVASPDLITSSASLSDVDQYDTVAGDDSSSITVSPQSADLAPTITLSTSSPVVGQNVTLTVQVTNSGPNAATNVKIAETLPAGFQYVSSSADAGTYSSATNSWSLASIASGQTRTLTIVARVLSTGAATSTASVAAADQYDPNAGNNSASVTSSAVQVDLALASAFSDSNPKVGDTVRYVITLTSPGTADATGVQVSAPLPAGLTFVSASAGAGTYDSASGAWTVGAVAHGSTTLLTIQAKVGPAATTRTTATASLSPAPSGDAVASNNAASASLTAQSADLALTVSTDSTTPKMQSTMTFTLTVTNRGPGDATNIVVQHQPIPTGLTFVGFSGDGSYVPGTDVWNLGSMVLKPGQSATLRIQATPTDSDPHTISASIVASDQYDGDDSNGSASVTFEAQEAELGVSVDLPETAPTPGEAVSIVVHVTNSGPDAATNVRVQTALPPGLTFVSASGTGTYQAATGLWTVGGLPSGAAGTVSLTINAIATSSSSGDFTATILPQEQYDSIPDDDSASVLVSPRAAGLSVATAVDDATPNVGDAVTATATVTNAGPDTVTNLVIHVVIPDGTTLSSSIVPDGTTYDPATGTWTIPSLAPGVPISLPLKLLVGDPAVKPFSASLQTVDAFNTDPDHTASSVAITPQQADLYVAATADVTRPDANQVVTFTFTLSDLGPDPATNTSVSIPIPSGYTFSSASATVGSYDSAAGVWTVGTVAPGTPVVLTLQAAVTAATVPPMVATISGADQYDASPANNTASVFIKPRTVDLVIGKVVSDPTPNVGDTVSYTIVVKNGGNDDATGVAVSEVLPTGMVYVSSSGDGSYDDTTGVWTVGSVAKGGEATLNLVVTVDTGFSTINTATVSAVDQFDVDSANGAATTTVDPLQADLLLTTVVDDPSPLVGQSVTFTIDLKNLGKDGAGGVAVTVSLPAGLTLDTFNAPAGTSYDSTTGIWTIGAVAVGETTSLTITATVGTTDASTLTAAVTADDQFDPNVNDDSASATVRAQTADLGLKFTIDQPRPAKGQFITATLDLTNAGPDDATGVTVRVPIPAGFELVSPIPWDGSYDQATGVWTVGNVAAGSSTRLMLGLQVLSGDPATLTAQATADQEDPAPDDDNIAAVVTPLVSGLSIATVVDDDRPNSGELIAFTVTLADAGPDDAPNALVQALLPAGLVYVGSQTTRGTYNPNDGIWSIADVPSGSTSTLTIWARTSSPLAATLVASIVGSDAFDLGQGAQSASATETPHAANVQVTSSVDNDHPNVGDTVTATVTVSNAGPDDATGITVNSVIPAGAVLLGYTTAQGVFVPITGDWTVGDIPAGQSVTLTYQFRVAAPGAMTLTTTVASFDQFAAAAAEPSSVEVTPQSAEVGLTMTAGTAKANVGDVVDFFIVASNSGPDAATDLRISTGLGAGLSYQLVNPPDGTTFDPITGDWIVPSLAANSSITLTLKALVTSPGTLPATATISGADQYDPDATDQSVEASVQTRVVGLALAQSLDDASPTAGAIVTSTVTVSNAGPDDATDVVIHQPLLPGMEWVSGSSGGATYDPATGDWTIPSIPAGGSVTLTLRASVTAPGEKELAAGLSSVSEQQPSGVLPAIATLTPQAASVSVTTVVDDDRPDADQLVHVTITVANSGPDAATGVIVGTSLPAGLTFVSSDAAEGAYNAATGAWTPGTVAAGGSRVLHLVARATAAGTETASATLTSVDQFDATTADDSSSVTLTPHQADLFVRLEGLPSSVTVGSRYDLRVVVSNSGPDAATNVGLPVSIPAGFRLVAHADGLGSFDPTSGVWAVGEVPSGGSFVLTLTLEPISAGSLQVYAGPASSSQFGTDAAVATASAVSQESTTTTPTGPTGPTTPAGPTPPTGPTATAASLTGVVYLDRNRNGVYDAGKDMGVATIRVILVGTDAEGHAVRMTTTTGADGSFAFRDVPSGTYSVIEQAPARYFRSARAAVGTLGGTTIGGKQVQQVTITTASAGAGYDFGNVPRPGCRMNLLMHATRSGGLPRGPILSRFFPATRTPIAARASHTAKRGAAH